ncbi:MAG: hypothetical protein JWR77_2267 [Rhizorhabdus sp.]|nr:hypothetical protein [Rhizorhabdus sp.]
MAVTFGPSRVPARKGHYRWYVLAILTAAQACHTLDRAIFGLLLESLRHEFALSDQQLGLVAGLAYGVAFAVAAVPIGMLVDRANRRNLLAVALTLWSGFTIICGLTTSFIGLMFSRSAVGAAESAGAPTGLSLLTDHFGAGQRSSAVSIWYLSSGIGTTLAFIVGGYVIEHHGWRSALLIAGAPGLCIAVLLLLTVSEPLRGATDAIRQTSLPGSFPSRLRAIAATPGLAHCIAGIILTNVTLSGIGAWMASFFVRSHGLSLTQIGIVIALALGLLGSVGGLFLGFAVDRLDRRRGYHPAHAAIASAISVLAAAALAAFTLLAPSAGVAITLFMACGIMLTAHFGPANGLAITLAGSHERGLAVAIVQFGSNLVGFGLGPLIVGVISGHFAPQDGVRLGLLALLAFNVWSAVHFMLSARSVRKDRQGGNLQNREGKVT